MAVAPNAYWRDSARNPRFFMVDALAALPLVLFLLHIRAWTFYLAIFAVVFFAILERFNFTVPVFLRWVRSTIAGKVKVAKPSWRE
jgi:intracellular multiplication protein IcmT